MQTTVDCRAAHSSWKWAADFPSVVFRNIILSVQFYQMKTWELDPVVETC